MDFEKIQYSKNFEEITNDIQELTNALNGKSDKKYMIIPKTEKGKSYIKINMKPMDEKNNYMVFFSPQTVGIKKYDRNNKSIYNYSVSYHNKKRKAKLNLPKGESLTYSYSLNQNNDQYEKRIEQRINFKTLFDEDMLIEPLKNKDIYVGFRYYLDNDEKIIVDTIIENENGEIMHLYDYPDLNAISQIIEYYSPQIEKNFLETITALEDFKFGENIMDLKQSFKNYINSFKQEDIER